jgi:hypothetical protein
MYGSITRSLLIVAASLGLLAGAADAAQKAASIPFADIGNIRDWHSDSADELYVEAMNKKWYRATFWAPCQALPFALAIAFVTEPNGSLDAYSSILVDGERCWFRTFEPTEAPKGDRSAR